MASLEFLYRRIPPRLRKFLVQFVALNMQTNQACINIFTAATRRSSRPQRFSLKDQNTVYLVYLFAVSVVVARAHGVHSSSM